MWPMAVVVVDELTEYDLELAPVEDQHPVETLPADSADKALGEGIGSRSPHWSVDDPDALAPEPIDTVLLEKVAVNVNAPVGQVAADAEVAAG